MKWASLLHRRRWKLRKVNWYLSHFSVANFWFPETYFDISVSGVSTWSVAIWTTRVLVLHGVV